MSLIPSSFPSLSADVSDGVAQSIMDKLFMRSSGAITRCLWPRSWVYHGSECPANCSLIKNRPLNRRMFSEKSKASGIHTKNIKMFTWISVNTQELLLRECPKCYRLGFSDCRQLVLPQPAPPLPFMRVPIVCNGVLEPSSFFKILHHKEEITATLLDLSWVQGW